MNLKFLLTVAAAALVAAPAASQKTEWTASTIEKPWQKKSGISHQSSANTIIINPSSTAQTWGGWGTCFSEQTWKALDCLTPTEKTQIMSNLFSQKADGAKLTVARTPIGASDFALEYYSYDETPEDFQLKDFSVKRDEGMLIPLIQSALKQNPNLKIWGSPWCPPSWMKINKHYACNPSAKLRKMLEERLAQLPDSVRHRMGDDSGIKGWLSVDNGLAEDKGVYEGDDAFIQDPRYLSAYARYFGKYIEAYRQHGINIWMVMPQNEYNSAQPYPACVWKAKSLANFMGKYLGPEMKRLGVEMYYGTCERAKLALSDTIMNDPDVRKYVSGMGFQWAGKDALPGMHKEFPELPCFMTEQECGDGKNDWKGLAHSWDLMKHYLKNGVSQWYYWNTTLRENVPSAWGWSQNSLITVNEKTHKYRFTPEYWLLRHASHYILPGAKYIRLEGSYDNALAFVNTEGSIIVMSVNNSDAPVTITMKVGKKNLTATMQPKSVNTFKIM